MKEKKKRNEEEAEETRESSAAVRTIRSKLAAVANPKSQKGASAAEKLKSDRTLTRTGRRPYLS